MKLRNKIFIGIGSNIGNAEENCRQSINDLKKTDKIDIIQCSSFYKTEPVGMQEQNWFINCVIEAGTTLAPPNLLFYLKGLESKMGRVQTIKWDSRVIDLDILFFNNEIIDTLDLKIPHPLNHKRMFVLEPMAEIAPDFMHPVLNKSINDLKKDIASEKQRISLYGK